MNRVKLSLLTVALLSSSIYADHSLEQVGVESDIAQGSGFDDSTIGSKQSMSIDHIKLINSAEMINPYKAISTLPGVDIRFNDPFGMSISHRIRGKSNRNIGETVDGLPLKGIGPGGGLSTMVDIENLSSISVEKGAIKADSGFGYGGDNGMVNLHMRQPSNKEGVELRQSLGSYDFSKTYARVDSGEIAGSFKAFVSASISKADKFKGDGKAMDRKNVEFGLASAAGSPIEWEIFGIYNDQFQHNYKTLTYDQSRDLSKNKKLDYQTTNRNASDYYDYNRQDFVTKTLFGKLRIPLGESTAFIFRPYFLNDKGYSYSTNGAKVQDWLVDHDTYGAVAELEHKLDDDIKLKLGYWYQEDEPPGPPTAHKLRDAGTMAFSNWQTLVKVNKKHKFSSPFLTYEQVFGNTILEAGLKYLWVSKPELTTYKTAGIGDVGYKKALSQASEVAFVREAKTFGIFLPTIGASHYLNETTTLKASYGRNVNTASYGNYSPAFTQELVSTLWSKLKPEESDNLDLGVGYQDGDLSLSATAFYSLIKNVGGSFYDPALDRTYAQNSTKGRSYGLEVGLSYNLLDNLSIDASATYNRYAFTKNFLSAGNTLIESKGKQHPDVPRYFANIGATYDLSGYKISPLVRYVGKRYSDALNRYSVDGFIIADLAINKEFRLDNGQKLELSLSATNIFDKKYISTFSSSDTNLTPEIGYTIGSPRAFFGSLAYKF
ncbi:MAG: TonB-dependent receptor [Sulfuricurvum sp.]